MAEEAVTTTGTEATQDGATTQAETLLTTRATDQGGDTTQNTETKADEGTEEDPKAVVPEKYEFKAPEGTTLDQALIDEVTPIFKAKGFTQEEAQGLVDKYAGALGKFAEAQQQAWTQQQADWAAEFKADKEFGGDNAEASLLSANAAWKQFATEEEIKAVHKFGLANFPPMVKILTRVGRLMAEDKFHQGGSTTSTKTTAEKFYPGMNP